MVQRCHPAPLTSRLLCFPCDFPVPQGSSWCRAHVLTLLLLHHPQWPCCEGGDGVQRQDQEGAT